MILWISVADAQPRQINAAEEAGLTRLLDAFAAGSTTEEAIEMLSGGSLPAFDRAFAEWGHSRREVFENTDLVSYEKNEIEMGIRRRPK